MPTLAGGDGGRGLRRNGNSAGIQSASESGRPFSEHDQLHGISGVGMFGMSGSDDELHEVETGAVGPRYVLAVGEMER